MTVAQSHGKPRPEAPRPRDVPETPRAAVTAPDRDPVSGRFRPGNTAARARTLRRIAKQLPWLQPEQCEPWVRPYIAETRRHAAELLVDLGAVGPMASPVAEELATARLVYRALLQLGLAGDRKALDAARSWLREARQHALTLEALARQERGGKPPADPHARLAATFGAPTSEDNA